MKQTNDPLCFSCGAGLVRLDYEQWRTIRDACYSASLAYDEAVRDLAGIPASARVTILLRDAVNISPDPWSLREDRIDRFGMMRGLESVPVSEAADVVVECNGGDPAVKVAIPGYIDWWAEINWPQIRMFFEPFELHVEQNSVQESPFDSTRVTVTIDRDKYEAFDSGWITYTEAVALCRHLLATHGDRAFVTFNGGDDDLDSEFMDELYKEVGNENK